MYVCPLNRDIYIYIYIYIYISMINGEFCLLAKTLCSSISWYYLRVRFS